MNTKPGGGGKQQPYIPKGYGDKSGEYTTKIIKNQYGRYNFASCRWVRKVDTIYTYNKEGEKIPTNFVPNSVIKKEIDGKIMMERFFDKNGIVYLDIDYTNHGNTKTHPVVPHIHLWLTNDGEYLRLPWRNIK